MRQPDARDAAWILVLALLAMGVVLLLSALGLPLLAAAFQQTAFFGAPLLYARRAGLNPLAASGFVSLGWRRAALVLLASVGSLWLMYGLSKVQTELIQLAGYGKQAAAEEEQIRLSLESTS